MPILKIAFRSAAVAAFALCGAGMGGPLAAGTTGQARIEAASPSSAEAGQAAQLKSLDRKLLYRRMMQIGMLSQVLGYKLSVDAEGRADACSFSRSFKSPNTTRLLCDAFRETAAFEPARDASGRAVAGTYEGEIAIASFFQPSR